MAVNKGHKIEHQGIFNQMEKRKKITKNSWEKWNTNSKMIELNPAISIIKLNVNGLNILFKGRDCQSALKNQDPNLCYLEEVHCKYKDK